MFYTTLEILMAVFLKFAGLLYDTIVTSLTRADGSVNWSVAVLLLLAAELVTIALYLLANLLLAKVNFVRACLMFVCACLRWPMKAAGVLLFLTMGLILADSEAMQLLRELGMAMRDYAMK